MRRVLLSPVYEPVFELFAFNKPLPRHWSLLSSRMLGRGVTLKEPSRVYVTGFTKQTLRYDTQLSHSSPSYTRDNTLTLDTSLQEAYGCMYRNQLCELSLHHLN